MYGVQVCCGDIQYSFYSYLLLAVRFILMSDVPSSEPVTMAQLKDMFLQVMSLNRSGGVANERRSVGGKNLNEVEAFRAVTVPVKWELPVVTKRPTHSILHCKGSVGES